MTGVTIMQVKKACQPRLYDVPACILHGPGDGKQGAFLQAGRNRIWSASMLSCTLLTEVWPPLCSFVGPAGHCSRATVAGIWNLPAKYQASRTSKKRWEDLY